MMMIKLIISKSAFLAIPVALLVFACSGEKKQSTDSGETMNATTSDQDRIKLVENDAERRVDVYIDGGLFTAYIYPTSIKKPVLWPIKTAKGTTITRGFPLDPKPGERVDHPHHVGLWFNYGNVNHLDFWNNSDSIKAEKRQHYGTIHHQKVLNIQNGNDQGILEVLMTWDAPDGTTLLDEHTKFVFSGDSDERVIDRITTLKAHDQDVHFYDNKEGVLGMRVTRALELPEDKPTVFTDESGKATKVPVLNNEGVNGNYYNSNGVEGNDCWGKRADWTNLASKIGDEGISVVILDNPGNVGYPTYWHARGYGLFAANPLGQKIFSDGKEELNYTLAAGDSVTFKYRIIIHSGDRLTKEQIDQRFEEFSKM